MSSIGCAPSLSATTRTGGERGRTSGISTWPGFAPAAEAVGVPLDRRARERFALYRDLLVDRAGKFNLTAVRDPREIERRLFLDALAMAPTLDQLVRERPGGRQSPLDLVDVGSGAGFPGLALKIARPELRVTLIDATAKKVAFLAEVIAALELEDVRAVHGRAEELGHDPSYRSRFDFATARAVASLPVLLEYVVPLLEIGGAALLPKGTTITDELSEGRRAAALLGAEITAAALLPTGETRLVVAKKLRATLRTYPRRAGVATRSPIGRRS